MTDNTINTEVTMRDATPSGGAKRFRMGDEILGRYVVESELGQGGMGVVYLCLDKVGGVKVAVKGLPPEVSHNSDEMESVRENFQLVSELQHPNIAGVRTLEKDEKTGDYYLVMAYARGVSIKHWLRQHGGKEHRGEQLKVLRQIAAALDYAHNAEPKHIIHRDIKPENVMVDERGKVSVLDFGLAAQVRSSLSRVSQVVTSRSGTPAYKSPEQWLAQAQRAPSDQYSLGVIAYQMFAGELPYDSDDIEILKHAVVFDSVPAIPSEGKAVNLVFAKVLAKKPQERFASCTAFVDALEGKKGVDAGAFARRPRFGLVAAGIAGLAAIAGGVWMLQCPRVQGGTGRTDPVASVDKPAPAMPLVKTQMVEKAVEKIVEKPIVTQAVEKVVPVAPARADETADRRRQEEVAKLTTTQTKISIKVAAAKEDYAKIAPFRSEQEGFETHLKEIDRQWRTVEGIPNPKTLAEAEKALAAVTVAADAIAFELNWLATNRDRRDAAMRIEKEIAGELEAKLREFKADDVAKSKYGKGQDERKTAAQALSRGEFMSARRQYEAAKATLSAALAEARQFHIKTALVVANEYKTAAQWQRCIDEAQKVIGWDPQNAEALSLMREAESHLGPKIGDTKTIVLPGGVTMDFCWCPATTSEEWKRLSGGKEYFLMGSSKSEQCRKSNEILHRVKLTRGFWIGKYEVTQRQWESVMGRNPSCHKGANRPVEQISWEDCQKFVRKINAQCTDRVSLPSEAQWEYGCRAGTVTPFNFGLSLCGDKANCDGSKPYGTITRGRKRGETCDVGTYDQNAWGMYDMHGNVTEWCLDWYDGDFYAKSPEGDPVNVVSNECRVCRGGDYVYDAQFCRSAFRNYLPEGNASNVGCRLVCAPDFNQQEAALRSVAGNVGGSEGDRQAVDPGRSAMMNAKAFLRDGLADLAAADEIAVPELREAREKKGCAQVVRAIKNFYGLSEDHQVSPVVREEAMFMIGESWRLLTKPEGNHETYRVKAKKSYAAYVNKFPQGRYVDVAAKYLKEYEGAQKESNGAFEQLDDVGHTVRNVDVQPCYEIGNGTQIPVSMVKPCDCCGGTGRNVCRECGPIRDQTGKVVCEHGISCPHCNGTGKRNSGFFTEPCSDCRGRGWERHSKCAGSGFLSGVCPKCKGTKMISAGSN